MTATFTKPFYAMSIDYPGRQPVRMDYTNWEGKREGRTITPLQLVWGSNQWHPEVQWLLVAFCHRAKAERAFALKNVHSFADIVP